MLKQILRYVVGAAVLSLSLASAGSAQVYLSTTDTTVGPLIPTTNLYVQASGGYGFNCAPGRAFCAFNAYHGPSEGLSAPGATTFVFNGGLFEATTYSLVTIPTTITFVGSDGVSTFTSAACTLSTATFTFCANTFTNPIKSITFQTTTGTSQTPDGGFFIANDLTFNGVTTTPEPSSIALLGTGLLGFVPMLRNRKKI